MDMASIVQNKVIVMFIMVLIGMVCAKVGLVDESTNKKLSNITMMLVSPLLMFSSFQIDFSMEMLQNLLISLGLSVACFAVAIVLSYVLIRGKDHARISIERLSMIYSNCGFIGIPLTESLYGKEGVFYVTVFITVFNLLLWTQGVILMTGKASGKQMLKNLCTPAIFAILLGLVCFVAQIRLPAVLLEPIESIGSMNTPLAMLVAGITLGHSNWVSCLKKARTYYLVLVKLIVIPLVCVLLLRWLPISPILLMVPLIAEACPSGAASTMFALRYNGDSAHASELFAITTVLSIITIPMIVRLCGMMGIM